jgi:hypothetical protein
MIIQGGFIMFKSIITEEQKEELRNDILTGSFTLRELGQKYGVSGERIRQISLKMGVPHFQIKHELKKEKARARSEKKWGKERLSGTALYDAQRAKFRQKKANNKKWEWTIEFGDLEWPDKCPVLGIPLNYFVDTFRQEDSPSIDRIDSSKGYIPGNVVVISYRANRIKNDGTPEEHAKIAEFFTR